MKKIVSHLIALTFLFSHLWAGGGLTGGGSEGGEEGGQADEIRMKIVNDMSNFEELLGDEGAGGPQITENIVNVHNISVKEFINFHGSN